METKKCPQCGIEKPLSEFSRDVSRKSQKRIWCKQCDSIRAKDYRLRNKIKSNVTNNLTYDELEFLLTPLK